jgi:hypothetical protein
MKKIKHLIGYLILIIIVIFLVKLNKQYGNDQIKNYYQKLALNGIVSKKYVDKKQHNYPILEIQSNEGIQEVNLCNDNSGLFDYVQESDSVVKIEGTLNVIVFRNNIETTFILKLNKF